MASVTVVIADRHPLLLRGLISLLRDENDFSVVASCRDGAKCLQAMRSLTPDIALLDIAMPGLSGLEILVAAKSERLGTRLVFLTASMEERELSAAAVSGAYGVVPKDAAPQMLIRCLRRVARGRRMSPLALRGGESRRWQGRSAKYESTENALAQLTDRERQIVQLVSVGLSNKEVGGRLELSDGTIKVHLHNIYQKLAIHNRTTLAALSVGLVP
jgi:two-component system, NarL family, nitrate/nitrite response regulator NarL